MKVDLNNLTLEEIQSLKEDLMTLKDDLKKKVPQNNRSLIGSTQITLETALSNIGKGTEANAKNAGYTKGDLQSFFDSLSKSGIEFRNTELIGNLLNKDHLKVSQNIGWYLQKNIEFLNKLESQKIANEKKSEKEVSELFENLGNIAHENEATQNEKDLRTQKDQTIKQFNSDLAKSNGQFSNEDIAKIYNIYGKHRDVILSAIDDQKLKGDFTKVLETLDKKATINENQDKVINPETIKNLTPGVLDSFTDTLKAVANFFVKVLTIGYKKGFDRSDYETKTNYQSSVNRIEKSVKPKSPIKHAKQKDNGNGIGK